MAASKRASFERENVKLFREIDCGSSPDKSPDEISRENYDKWRRKGLRLKVKISNYFVKLFLEVLQTKVQMKFPVQITINGAVKG